MFPQLPTRTRLFRWLNAYQALTATFLAEPPLLGVMDSYGIVLVQWHGREPHENGFVHLSIAAFSL